MNKAELLEALQRQTKLRPTHVKRVVDAIFDPENDVISRQIKRGGKVTIAGFGTFDRRNHKARDVNSDPYGAGWMIRIRPDDPSSVDSLMDASAYTSRIG